MELKFLQRVAESRHLSFLAQLSIFSNREIRVKEYNSHCPGWQKKKRERKREREKKREREIEVMGGGSEKTTG
jgi:CelD/BcsL family acetyltransferase involved in cellulose biosynthesis